MAKKLACRLGRHDWTTHVEEGESYKVCAACGKSPREPGQPGPLGQQRDQSLAGGGDPGIAGNGGGGGKAVERLSRSPTATRKRLRERARAVRPRSQAAALPPWRSVWNEVQRLRGLLATCNHRWAASVAAATGALFSPCQGKLAVSSASRADGPGGDPEALGR